MIDMARFRANAKSGTDTMPDNFLIANRARQQPEGSAAALQDHPLAECRTRYFTAENIHV